MKRYLRIGLLVLFAICALPCAGALWALTTGLPVIRHPTATVEADDFSTFREQLLDIQIRVMARIDDFNEWQQTAPTGDAASAAIDRCHDEWRFYADMQLEVGRLPAPPDCRQVRDTDLQSLSERQRSFDLLIRYVQTADDTYWDRATEAIDRGNRLGLQALEGLRDLRLEHSTAAATDSQP